jgi:hypothetical protein
MLSHVGLVRTNIPEECVTSIRGTRIGMLETMSAVTSKQIILIANVSSSPIFVTVMIEGGYCSSKTSVLARATCRNITEDSIHHSHRHENLKSYNF